MTYQLISHYLCPYVQRAAISFAEKGVPFERTYIDLSSKPDWFRQVSPLGKVPVLKSAGHTIFESAVILEYLEETLPNPLHPADPLERARHRAWMEYGSSVLADISAFYNAPDEAAFEKTAARLHEKFARLEEELGDGPWFSGPQFSLVDAVFAPVFRYFDVFDQIGDFGILTGLPKISAWRIAMSDRPSVIDAVTPDYPQRLLEFLRQRGSYLTSLLEKNTAAAA